MSKLKILFLIFAVTFFSCAKKTVIYAKYGRLKLSPNEVNSYPVNNGDVNSFENCCYTNSDVIFLNRAIHNAADGTDIYISVSETIHQSEFSAIQQADKSIQLIQSKTDLVSKIKVDGYFLKKNDYFISRFVFHEVKSGLLIIYDFSSKQEEKAKSTFDNMIAYLDEKIKL